MQSTKLHVCVNNLVRCLLSILMQKQIVWTTTLLSLRCRCLGNLFQLSMEKTGMHEVMLAVSIAHSQSNTGTKCNRPWSSSEKDKWEDNSKADTTGYFYGRVW
jgi:hypothetical protein